MTCVTALLGVGSVVLSPPSTEKLQSVVGEGGGRGLNPSSIRGDPKPSSGHPISLTALGENHPRVRHNWALRDLQGLLFSRFSWISPNLSSPWRLPRAFERGGSCLQRRWASEESQVSGVM